MRTEIPFDDIGYEINYLNDQEFFQKMYEDSEIDEFQVAENPNGTTQGLRLELMKIPEIKKTENEKILPHHFKDDLRNELDQIGSSLII